MSKLSRVQLELVRKRLSDRETDMLAEWDKHNPAPSVDSLAYGAGLTGAEGERLRNVCAREFSAFAGIIDADNLARFIERLRDRPGYARTDIDDLTNLVHCFSPLLAAAMNAYETRTYARYSEYCARRNDARREARHSNSSIEDAIFLGSAEQVFNALKALEQATGKPVLQEDKSPKPQPKR